MCKACHFVEESEPACTYRNQLGSTVTATAGVTTDVANDPTVGATSDESPYFCAMCGEELRCNECGKGGLGDLDATDEVEVFEEPKS
jgi:DNA-directed RNA polymerase II subunit RPB9